MLQYIVSVLHMYESVCVVLLPVSHTYNYTVIERERVNHRHSTGVNDCLL